MVNVTPKQGFHHCLPPYCDPIAPPTSFLSVSKIFGHNGSDWIHNSTTQQEKSQQEKRTGSGNKLKWKDINLNVVHLSLGLFPQHCGSQHHTAIRAIGALWRRCRGVHFHNSDAMSGDEAAVVNAGIVNDCPVVLLILS